MRKLLALSVFLLIACTQQPQPAPSPAPVAPVPAPEAKQPETQPEPQKPVKPTPKKQPAKKPTQSKKPAAIKPIGAPMIVGWAEHVMIGGMESPVKAKLDSGADTSSINANIIRTFKKKGQEYIVFRFQIDEEAHQTFETKIIRWVRIKGKKAGAPIRRPVVMLDFCLGERKIREEVNLADREHFKKSVLIGRNMLKKGNIVLDATRQYTVEPSCR